MGKKQHQKDKLYISYSEHKARGGFKEKSKAPFSQLPFYCCAISFTPFTDPVCTDDGIVYDIVNAVPYVRKHKKHPVKGTPLGLADLIKLNFHKNADGEYACPVTGKVFTAHTHIVAVKPTGNVYAWEAVEELNIKPKSYRDLLTDEPFTRKDIIHIQDPLNLTARNIGEFDHVKKDLAVEDEQPEEAPTSIRNATDDMKRALGSLGTQEAQDALARGGGGKRAEAARLLADAKLQNSAQAGKAGSSGGAAAGGAGASADGAAAAGAGAGAGAGGEGDWRLRAPAVVRGAAEFKPGASTWNTEDRGSQAEEPKKRKHQQKQQEQQGQQGANGASVSGRQSPKEWYEAKHARFIESHTTTGAASRSFTSTVAAPMLKNARNLVRVERNPTKKGYVRLHTNLGDLNIELHCDLVPRTAENFLALSEMGYYDNVPFHRSIKNFMIQGGDPTGTGTGGESIYGPTFKDEVDNRLTHSGRGILSMANSGPGTNGSQFFILYKSAQHLNLKHSVFGRVVGGMETLAAMERVATDADDRPLQDIRITGVTIFTNPFVELEEEEKAAEAAAAAKAADPDDPTNPDNERGTWYTNPSGSKAQEPVRSSAVGKYLSMPAKQEAQQQQQQQQQGQMQPPPAKKAKVASQLSNFDAW